MASSEIKKPRFGAVSVIDLTTSWVAPSDGIVVHRIDFTSNSFGYDYIKDETADYFIGTLSAAGNLGGMTRSISFPVIGGHSYRSTMSAQIALRETHFFPL